MRLLHPRLHSGVQGTSRSASECKAGRNPSGPQRKSLPMPDYNWPDAEHRTLIGKRISRVDSPFKVSGRAKYTYDYRGANMLFGKVLRSPYAKAKIVSIDTSAAEKLPGVRAVHIIQKVGSTVPWAGDDIVAVAAVDESTAEDAARLIKVTYQR